jgi:hypothetical protein
MLTLDPTTPKKKNKLQEEKREKGSGNCIQTTTVYKSKRTTEV